MGKDSILLIDGSSMLATNYYGNMPKEILFEKDREKQKDMYDLILKDSKGRYTNGIYGMLKQMFKIIKEQKPTHIAIAFDKTRNTFRRELYADYKGKNTSATGSLSGYSDSGRVHSWAVESMKWAVGNGIIKGTTSTTLSPDGLASRAQFAAVAHRYLDKFGR